MIRYVLKYLKEEMYIEPVENSVVRLDEERFDSYHAIAYRLIINEKTTDIVVWHDDLNKWFVKKIDKLGINI
jgi:hypothetical protein